MRASSYGGGGSAAIAVPISFLQKYNPEQFEILDANDYILNPETPIKPHGLIKDKEGTVGGGIRSMQGYLYGGWGNNLLMGVPVSFIQKWCPDQFEIVGLCASQGKIPRGIENENAYLDGHWVYPRVLIRFR